MTARAAAALLALSLALAACESDAEQCARLQRAAAAAWQAYAAVLDAGETRARRGHEAAKARAGELEQGLLDAARKQADALYARHGSAWWRAVDAAQQTLCSKDPRCMQSRAEMAEAERTRDELARRLVAVRAAIDAASSAASDPARSMEAERAVSAVEDDFDRPEIKPARAASEAAQQVCAAARR